MFKSWIIKNADQSHVDELAQKLDIHPVLARLLINREILDPIQAKQFLNADAGSLHDPFLMKGMKKAVERIEMARSKKERVLVFGDYDVDGVVSSFLLANLLKELGLYVHNHIPHRFDHGYGVKAHIHDVVKDNDIDLVMTIDCGITAIEEVRVLKAAGVDTIIMDHHEASVDKMPDAFAIINPKQPGCPYPFKELASVGLAAKLHQAFKGSVPDDILGLVAIGTITDIVPLLGENRIFVARGLPLVDSTKNLGLAALLDVAKIKGKKVTSYHVGFIIGPRINASGRMDSAHHSLNLLMSKNKEEAYELALGLDRCNSDRQKIQRESIAEAIEMVNQEVNFKDHKVIVLSKEGWHKGVLGIVSSQITDRFYRPSIIISLNDGIGTASARSIDGFHLHDALVNCSQYLENFGGHEGAAGLTIKEENIDPFRDFINTVAHKTIDQKTLVPAITIEGEIALADITLELVNTVLKFAPFGEGNPEPVFCTKKAIVKGQPAVMGKETLKFWVTDGKRSISAVGFGMAKYIDIVRSGEEVDIAYQLSIDDWNKQPCAQLKLKDIRSSKDR